MSDLDARVRDLAARLSALGLYDRPLDPAGVRVVHAPRVFRLPWLRRFDGYALPGCVLLRDPPDAVGDDLLAHELCHVWQMRRRGARMPLSYLVRGYRGNPHEREARWAAERAGASAIVRR